MAKSNLTLKLQEAGVWLWCIGLGVIAADFYSIQLLEKRVTFSYVFFAASLGLFLWAERRIYGLRVTLYRLHDCLVYSPWRYLMLYFLWTSVIALFSPQPLYSVVAALNGWVSLLCIGVPAYFLFCDRTVSGDVLLLGRLRRAFGVYSLGNLFLMVALIYQLLSSQEVTLQSVDRQLNLFLYFSLGLPFLLWDFLRDRPRLLPRLLSGFTLLLGMAITVVIGKLLFQIVIVFSILCLLAFYLYKQIRLKRFLLLGASSFLFLFFFVLVFQALIERRFLQGNELLHYQEAFRAKMYGPAKDLLHYWRTNWVTGHGLGTVPVRGVWLRILAESGIVGFFLYTAFFLELLWCLFRVRRSLRVVVSNVTFISVFVFLLLVSHFVENPYGAHVWIWYSIWVLFSHTSRKREKTI